jgi:bifunctional non-homologous end joining protein LigD
VGTGFTFKQRSDLKKRLDKVARKDSPLVAIPKDPGLRLTQWTEPKMIAEVAFMEWTSDGSIRHPSFQGLREDKNSKEVIREEPKNLIGAGKRR